MREVENVVLSDSIQHPLNKSGNPKGKAISEDKRQEVVALKGEGLSNRAIVQRIGISLGSVSNIVRAASTMANKQGQAPKVRQTKTETIRRDKAERERTIAKRYKLPIAIVEAIKAAGPHHGSQGRALQLATEFLVRLARPVKIEMPSGEGAAIIGQSYKITPRTAQLIDQLVEQYGTRGAVLCACVHILGAETKVSIMH